MAHFSIPSLTPQSSALSFRSHHSIYCYDFSIWVAAFLDFRWPQVVVNNKLGAAPNHVLRKSQCVWVMSFPIVTTLNVPLVHSVFPKASPISLTLQSRWFTFIFLLPHNLASSHRVSEATRWFQSGCWEFPEVPFECVPKFNQYIHIVL